MKILLSLIPFVALLMVAQLEASSEASLTTTYTRMMEATKAEILRAVPQISQSKKSAYFQVLKELDSANERLEAEHSRLDAIKKAKGLVDHAKNHWIKKAENGISKSKAALKNAKTAAEKEKAQQELEKWEKNLASGQAALKERTENWEAIKDDGPEIERAIQKAKAEIADSRQKVVQAIADLGLNDFLSSDRIDGMLARYVALKEATPKALAAYAAQGPEQEQKVEAFLKSEDLLIQAAVADGPRVPSGRNAPDTPDYGRMLDIYSSILKTSRHASQGGVLQRLAMAVALEHAAPHGMRSAVADKDAPQHVDPLKRYFHFEQAFLDGQLDPNFENLTTWDLRMVVDGPEPEEILTWGREMLRNYRPDHITTADDRWRYVGLVRTDIRYGSDDNKHDRDDLQFFQNILKNGGICGRRAFIGRFILRAFGNPTTARPQTGHAALVRWTPDGWVPVLGGGWGSGWTKTPYGRDRDFLATTQARALGDHYLKVKRAHWVADVMGEPRVWGLDNDRQQPEFWNGVALYTQRALIGNREAIAAVGEELGEANFSDVVYATDSAEVTDADRKISVDSRGVIKIPAAATSEPKESKGAILFTPSVLGGLQLHYKRGGKTDFEYKVEAPEEGTYALVARVVTPSWQQNLVLAVNGKEAAGEIPLPHTVGMWDYTKPIPVKLNRGMNTLRFSHRADGQAKGFTIKEFQLAPVPEHARLR